MIYTQHKNKRKLTNFKLKTNHEIYITLSTHLFSIHNTLHFEYTGFQVFEYYNKAPIRLVQRIKG